MNEQKAASLERRVMMLEKAWLQLYEGLSWEHGKGEIRNKQDLDFTEAILEKEVKSHGS